MHDIQITKVANGYIVRAGCQTFVAVDRDFMLSEIQRYWDHPHEVEKEYLEKYAPEQLGETMQIPQTMDSSLRNLFNDSPQTQPAEEA